VKNYLKNKQKSGYLFWVTGFSGSGKTSIAKKIKRDIISFYGPTILISGDDVRNIFNLKGYSYKERYKTVMKYCKLAKFLTSQNINVIFAVVGQMDKVRNWNRNNIKNYIEIFLKADLKKIIKRRKKKIYLKKTKNVIGIDIKPEFPKNPDITINNNFKKNLKELSQELMKKIIKKTTQE